jgi:long-chain acyl-CoA synthetase
MPRETLVDFFLDFAGLPETFLVFDDGFRTYSYTYKQVAGAACAFARKLQGHGIAAGQRVVFWSENRPEWIAAFWGCVLAKVVVVPVDYRASKDLLYRIAGIVDARAVLTGDQVESREHAWKFADFDWAPAPFSESFTEGRNGAELAEIIFTSGATAEPKGVTITHANILANIVPVETEIRKYRKWSIPFAPIRFLNLLPLSHMFGQSMATFIPPVLPGQVIFMKGVNPREIVGQIHRRRISVLVSVPKILEVLRTYILQAVPDAATTAPPRTNWVRHWWHYRRVHNVFGWKFWSFIAGAAPLPPDLETFWSNLGFVVVQGYGLTETAPIVTLNHPFHTSHGSVGKPIGGVKVKIAYDGEILVRGANVTAGYFNASLEDQASFEDGWFHTGDIGSVDEEGKVFVRGRKKEMIVLPDGLNVFPEDVERVLNETPGVRESAVVGNDEVHAVLVLERGATAETVVEDANKRLETQQQIRSFSLWPPGESLPRTEGTGKLKRVAIRDWVNGAARPAEAILHERLLGGYPDETSLAQLGLSSLDRVELMMQSGVDEASFLRARTVGDLRTATHAAVPAVEDPIPFPRWTRSAGARALRGISLSVLLLPLLRIFVWLRVSGQENLRKLEGPVVFGANHQSVFDVPTILAAMPGRWRYHVATAAGVDWFRAHFHTQNAGWLERLGNNLQYYLSCLFFNTFPLPQTDAGARESLRYMGELVGDGFSIILFPEGIRTSTGEIAPFRPGVGLIGARLNLKIVPVKIEGLDKVLHTSWYFPRPGRVRVSFGEAISATGDDYTALAAQVERAVRSL